MKLVNKSKRAECSLVFLVIVVPLQPIKNGMLYNYCNDKAPKMVCCVQIDLEYDYVL